MFAKTLAAAVTISLLAGASPLVAQQSPNTTPTTVSRIILVKIKPGHGDQFWADLRRNLKPVYDEQKRKGILANWAVATKVTTENADDWNVAIILSYPNWAGLDNLGSRTDSISLAHYGNAPARTAANIARLEHSTVVSSFLVRDQTVNPWR